MSVLTWNMPARIVRGMVAEASDSCPLQTLSTRECWERAAELSTSLANSNDPVSVTCEIWLDSGRIIWVLKDKREFCRIELSSLELEKAYFAISASESFEQDYEDLLSQIKKIVKAGSKAVDLSFTQRAVVQDSDDVGSKEIV